MKDFTLNIPEIVSEVRELFERYEAALEAKDVAGLDATFWNSPHTIRYALHENGYGFEAIHKWPARPAPASRNTASALRFSRSAAISRRSTSSSRCADAISSAGRARRGCDSPSMAGRIVAAHVSTVSVQPFW